MLGLETGSKQINIAVNFNHFSIVKMLLTHGAYTDRRGDTFDSLDDRIQKDPVVWAVVFQVEVEQALDTIQPFRGTPELGGFVIEYLIGSKHLVDHSSQHEIHANVDLTRQSAWAPHNEPC